MILYLESKIVNKYLLIYNKYLLLIQPIGVERVAFRFTTEVRFTTEEIK